MDGTLRQSWQTLRTRWLRCSPHIRWLARVLVACALMGATVSVATPLAGAYSNAHHRRHARHHRRHRHHRRYHRGHHSRREPSAHSAQDTRWSATAPCPYADTPATSASLAQMDQALDCLVNQERLKFGLPPLNPSDKLNTSAQNWNDHMVGTGDFTHGSDQAFSNRLLAVGYNWEQGGENIATGYMTPRDAVAGWMASQEHCQNLLEPDYADMGTGETPAPVGNFAGTPATWTQDFGTLMGRNSPSNNYGPMNGCPYTIPSSPNPAASSGSGPGGTPTSTTPTSTTPSGTTTTSTTPSGPTGPTGPSGY